MRCSYLRLDDLEPCGFETDDPNDMEEHETYTLSRGLHDEDERVPAYA